MSSDPTVGLDVIAVSPPATIAFLKNRIMLALPWGKMTHPITAFAVAQLMDRRRTTTALNFGDAFVAHSRNSIADVFLKSTSEYLLTVDDDMIVPFGHPVWFRAHTGWEHYPDPFASFNVIDRLLSHGKTLVGALYKGRYQKANFVYGEGNQTQEREYASKGPYDVLKPTRWVGTGSMLIHRTVFEDVEKKFPLLARGADGKGGNWFTSSEHNAMDAILRTRRMLSEGAMTGEKCMRAFEMLEAASQDAKSSSKLGVGEDVQFCTRAKAAGHQPYVDMGLRCGHLGHFCY